MRSNLLLPAIRSLGLLFMAVSAVVAEQPDYRLVWADEFNTPGPPDPKKWMFEHGFVRNEEHQWFQPQNAVCRDGILFIEARRERVVVPKGKRRWGRTEAEYTSASIKTRGLASWTYGRFEMRAKIDVRMGLWPAWWTTGSAREWPGCGEIDIMEYFRDMLLVNAAFANRDRTVVWDSVRTPLAELGGPKWADSFHVWRMDWDEKKIEVYVDDRLLNAIDIEATYNTSPDGANPFREPHYMRLNLSVGGLEGGNPSNTEFPGRFEVDYVRVYQH